MYPLQAGAGSINSLTVSILQYCTHCTVYSTVQLDFVPRRGQSNEIFISMLSLFEATWAADQRVNIFFLFFIFYSSLESWFGRILFTPWGLIPRGVRFPNWNRNKNQNILTPWSVDWIYEKKLEVENLVGLSLWDSRHLYLILISRQQQPLL